MRFNSLLALSTLLVAAPLSAQSIIKDNSAPISVTSITDFSTEFNKVGGMKVSWTLSPSGGSSAIWGNIAGTSGIAGAWGIWTNNLKIWGNGATDTYGDNVWNFWGNNITSVTMEALLGNGVFDVLSCSNSPCSTENSSSGKQFNWDGSGPDSRVTYSNPIKLGANAFVGDLYGTLKLDFGNYGCTGSGYKYDEDSGLCKKKDNANQQAVWIYSAFGDSGCDGTKSPTQNQSGSGDNTKCYEQFDQDMDNLGINNPGGGAQEVVPEPATMTLLATGLVGMAAARRRKHAAK